MQANVTRRAAMAGAAALAAVPASAEPAANPAYRTATELVRALAARETTSVALTEAAIARIEALDPKVNAVVVRDFDRARAAAEDADAALARGERRPLLGLPMTVKEQYNIAGLPTTWGYKKYSGWRADTDALVVQRLKASGAVVLGKTNVPESLSDWQSYNDVYGTTNNPWDTTRTPGGSSGGAAAALAAGFVPLELGSDMGGSLRAPAHYCGVFAHKTSIGIVPLRGAAGPDAPVRPIPPDMAVTGPMARSAADLRLALGVLAGPDPLWDGIGYRLELPPARHTGPGNFKVLVLGENPLCPVARSVQDAVDGLAHRLSGLGCTVLRRHPGMPNLARTTRVYIELLAASLATELPAQMRASAAVLAGGLSPEIQDFEATELRGATMTHAAWQETSGIRGNLRAAWQAMFKDIDVIICPAMPTPAFPHDHSPKRTRGLDVDGTRINYNQQLAWAALATVNGFPATAVPVGRSESGLPIGVQVIGGYLDDLTTIAFAEALERELGGFSPPPGFA